MTNLVLWDLHSHIIMIRVSLWSNSAMSNLMRSIHRSGCHRLGVLRHEVQLCEVRELVLSHRDLGLLLLLNVPTIMPSVKRYRLLGLRSKNGD